MDTPASTQPPRVSIVLPVYNGAAYLAQAIDSCRAQSMPNWELILVDDGSTDATPDIVTAAAASDPRIRAVRHEENRKLPAALNTGFRLARGDCLTWTSHDNRFHPDALSVLLAALDAPAAPDIVYSDFVKIDGNGRVLGTHRVREPQHLGFRGNVVLASFLYRRAVHEAVGGYAEDLFFAEDYYFWLRVADRFTLRTVQTAVYDYRVHRNALSADLARQASMTVQALERALPLTRRRALRAGIRMHLALAHAARGDRAAMWHEYARAWREDPWATFRFGPTRFLLHPAVPPESDNP